MSETFCPLLFQHLATHPHGGVTHCCIADHRNALSSSRDDDRYYNLNRDTVYDIMNSKSFRINLHLLCCHIKLFLYLNSC